MTITESRRQQYAELLRQRRNELGIWQDRLRDHGGPSAETVNKYEAGEIPAEPQDRTLDGFDRALGWAPGSSRKFLDTGIPPAIVVADIPVEVEVPGWVSLPKPQVQNLIAAVTKIDLLARSGADREALAAAAGTAATAAVDLSTLVIAVESGDADVLRILGR